MKRTELYKLLQSAGLHSQYLGYEYFADAVWLAAKDPARLHNMRRDIYLPVAALHQVSCSSVERDIRTIGTFFTGILLPTSSAPSDFRRSGSILSPIRGNASPFSPITWPGFLDMPGFSIL